MDIIDIQFSIPKPQQSASCRQVTWLTSRFGDRPKRATSIHWFMKKIGSLIVLTSCCVISLAQQPNRPERVAGHPVNYQEDRVGTYTLPDLLVCAGGTPVSDAKDYGGEQRGQQREAQEASIRRDLQRQGFNTSGSH